MCWFTNKLLVDQHMSDGAGADASYGTGMVVVGVWYIEEFPVMLTADKWNEPLHTVELILTL